MEQFDLIGSHSENGDSQLDRRVKMDDAPLAGRMRPTCFDEYIGQEHILGEGKLLRRAIDADSFTSIILHGPPGVGKTSLAELIAGKTNSAFIRLSGVISNVSDIRREIASAKQRKEATGRRTVLFIDEIHRFSKSQQDILLPDVENGNIRLIGATTHNPHFYVINTLLSRSLLFQLQVLSRDDITKLLFRTLTDNRGFQEKSITLTDPAAKFLSEICEGDARKSLNALEIAVLTTDSDDTGHITVNLLAAEASVQQKSIVYDDDGHYDTTSAFIKSMRGSDPDAALYWLAKMLHAGEDIRFIARRITIFASEDIGNADPRALSIALSAMQAVEIIGMPEAKLILSQAVTYCATAPKSNASCVAIGKALKDIASGRVHPVPMHLKDAHYSGAKKVGHGSGYIYPHDYEGNFVVQDYAGVAKSYYEPSSNGYESKIKERMAYWKECRTASKDGQTRNLKSKLREEYLEKRKNIADDERKDLDAVICKNLANIDELATTEVIAAYVSDGTEPSLSFFIEEALKNGKRILLPRHKPSSEGYLWEMVEIESLEEDLVTGKYGISEPSSTLPSVDKEVLKNVNWLVPGVVFDRTGKRLGRGKGVYDSLLKYSEGLKIGIFYECQQYASVPVEQHDCHLDMIATEKGVLMHLRKGVEGI